MPKPNFEDHACTPLTMANGSLGSVKYLTSTHRQTKSGGPVMWINFKMRCPDCNSVLFKDLECCTQVPEGMLCQPNKEGDEVGWNGSFGQGIGKGRCERFYTNIGADEVALNSEMGLYLDFKVSDTGIPYGCSGLESFNNTYWKHNGLSSWSRVPLVENPDPFNGNHWRRDSVTCPLNKLQEPSGSTPLHEIFEEYANDQQKWINDYVPTFEKMISNGYEDLQDAPDQWTDVICPRPGPEPQPYKYHSCVHASEINQWNSFFLINRKTGLAIQGDDQGVATLTTLDYANPRQRWVHTFSQELINMDTKLSLIILGPAGFPMGRAWKFDSRNMIIETVKGKGDNALFFWEEERQFFGSEDESKTIELTIYPIMEDSLETYQYDKVMYIDILPK